MGLFSKKKPQAAQQRYVPIPSNAKTVQEWQRWEMARGCSTCGQKGCHRMKHSYSECRRCGSAYCNGDACPGRRR